MKSTFFISDLHLEETRPLINEQFFRLLQYAQKYAQALYILGDLFEVWIGDDDDTPFTRQIIHALATATASGLPIYIVYGNRDFLIGKKFLRKTGCQLLKDVTKVTMYHIPLLLMHGDILCTRDIKYLKARRIVRNAFIRQCILWIPLSLRKKFANRCRAASQRHTQNTALEMMDVTQEEVERIMQQYQVRYLIHGHTHRPAIHEFKLAEQIAIRIVLPAWHDKGYVLVWDDAGKKEMLTVDQLTQQS